MGSLSARRRRGALLVGVTALAAAALVAAAIAMPSQLDLATTALGEPAPATLRSVATLEQEVTLRAFFGPRDPTWQRLRPWLEALDEASDHLRVERTSPDDPRYPAGVLAVEAGRETEVVTIGTRPAVARRAFARLDAEVLGAVARAVAPPRLTLRITGHGELELEGQMRALLQGAGLDLRSWDLSRPLPLEERPLVLLLSPRGPLAPGESAALGDYVQQGGRLLVVLDPDHSAEPPNELLASLGVTLRPGPLADVRGAARLRARGSAGHPISAELPAPVRVSGAFGFGRRGRVRSVAPLWVQEAYADADADGARTSGERLMDHPVMTATTFVPRAGLAREGRAVVLGDADLLGDEAQRRPGEAALLQRTLQWLLDDPGEAVRPVPAAPRPAEIDLLGDSRRTRTLSLLAVLPVLFLLIAAALALRARPTA